VPAACVVHFNLTGDEVDLGELRQWLGTKPSQRRWYQLTADAPVGPAFLANLRAAGKISVTRLRIREAVASGVSASLDLDRGKLKIADLRADFLGGKHRGDWQGDFTVSPAAFTGSGTLTAISLTQVAKIMRDHWIDGVASGNYKITAGGTASAEFWQSADGSVEVDVRDGTLLRLSLGNDGGPLLIEHFEGAGHLHDGKIEIKDARLSSPGNTFQVSGTVSLSREVDLQLARSPFSTPLHGMSRGYTMTGPLAQPHVLRVPGIETQAQLKVK
jgi:hypothetical protein